MQGSLWKDYHCGQSNITYVPRCNISVLFGRDQAHASIENVEKMTSCAKRAVSLWLEFAKAEDTAVTEPSQAEKLRCYDRSLYGFAWRDPDNEVMESLWLFLVLLSLFDTCAAIVPAVSFELICGMLCCCQKVAALIGEDALQEMLQLSTRDDSILQTM